uniref:Uncharacterized protein n=1 Tax=Oryza punctata TaxID=4537 RepID=A0A0E0JZ48_ORYPU
MVEPVGWDLFLNLLTEVQIRSLYIPGPLPKREEKLMKEKENKKDATTSSVELGTQFKIASA